MSRVSQAMMVATLGDNSTPAPNMTPWDKLKQEFLDHIKTYDDSDYEELLALQDDLSDLSHAAQVAYDKFEREHSTRTERGDTDRDNCVDSMRESMRGDAAEANRRFV